VYDCTVAREESIEKEIYQYNNGYNNVMMTMKRITVMLVITVLTTKNSLLSYHEEKMDQRRTRLQKNKKKKKTQTLKVQSFLALSKWKLLNSQSV